MKHIEFRPSHPEYDIPLPRPASAFIPDWYKKTPIVSEKVLTAKRCVPIIDSLSAGYIIPLPADVHWNPDGSKPWADSKLEVVSMHHASQTENFDLGDEYETQPWKWINNFHIQTPKGYSTLFVHPVNRTELPFYSFSGLVDTDKHPLITNFPFAIKKGFSGVIPAGTPMIQAIPVKREDWEMKMKDEDKAYRFVREYEVMNAPFAWYRRNVWQKKKYQ
jgi:hypothetical protein